MLLHAISGFRGGTPGWTAMAAFGSRLPGLKCVILTTRSARKSSPISTRFLPPGMEPNQGKAGGLFGGKRNRKGWLRIGAMDMEILIRRFEFTGYGKFSLNDKTQTMAEAICQHGRTKLWLN